MLFRLKNAPACFQCYMDKVLRGVPKAKAECYIDDLLLKSETFEEHLVMVKRILRKLSDAGLMVCLDKCHFLRKSVNYPGYIISEQGLLPGDRKVSAIHNFPTPKTLKHLQSFHGLCSYFRQFIPNFAHMAQPLTKLFQKDCVWEWRIAQQLAFEALKDALTSAEMLAFPDPNKPFYLHTDASIDGLGSASCRATRRT